MCQICSQFNPFLDGCEYEGLGGDAPSGGNTGIGAGPSGVLYTEDSGDAAGNTSTGYAMGAGDYFHGTLSSPTESDWIAVTLQAGQTYSFGLTGIGALDAGVDDTYLRLRDSAGNLVDENDDIDNPSGVLFSALTYTATVTGTYYLDVQSWSTSPGGDYGLSMTTGTRPSFDAYMGAGMLLRPDASWAATPETGVTVTWAIRASGDDGNGFIAPSAAQVAAIEAAMAYIDGVSGLTLSQVNPGGTSNNATMLFGAYNNPSDGAGAYAYYPGSTAFSSDAGDVWLNNGGGISTTSLPAGSFSAFAILHEIGHAVGLAHPGGYNAGPGVSITYANNAEFIEDTHQYTVMSYFDESNTTSSFGSYPDGLMLYDLLALHQQYGADTSYHSGNTTYGFNATVGGIYDFTSNTNPVFAIWDGAGTDTLDVSGFSMDQVIRLGEGLFSDIGGLTGNISIAYGALIENAVGGTGADLIEGNDATNTLQGGAGDDTLIGGAGGDSLDGGANTDTVSYAGSTQGVGARLDGFASWGGASGDSFSSVENLTGSAHNDVLVGNGGANRLEGGTGDDTLWGSHGDDTLIGGAENDLLIGGGGSDDVQGGDGSDTASYAFSAWAVGARLDGGANWMGAVGDSFSSIENLTGSAYDDILVGNGGANRLEGGTGDDTLWAGGGTDTLTGGAGSDTFVFYDGNGGNVITDFEATNNAEKVDLSWLTAITDWADLINPSNPHMTQAGLNVSVDDFAGTTITIQNVLLADLNAADFIF